MRQAKCGGLTPSRALGQSLACGRVLGSASDQRLRSICTAVGIHPARATAVAGGVRSSAIASRFWARASRRMTGSRRTSPRRRLECGVFEPRGPEAYLDEYSLATVEGLLATVGRGLAADEKVIEVVVDSGAVESVAPPGLFPGTVEPSAMSRTGRTYRAANGSRIRNLGQVRVPFVSPEGHKCSFPFQVAEVEHALLSVGHLAAAGTRVELHDKGGLITNCESGKTMALVRRGGVYVLRMRVSGFPRPAAK